MDEEVDFAKAVGIEEVKTLDAFFEKAQKYIAYEEKHMAAEVRRRKSQEKDEAGPSRRGISSADFKKAGIQFPKQLPVKENMDRSKYCRYHRSYGHVTEDCVHLKDAIEILIQKGYARKYVKDGEKETHEAQMAIEAPNTEEEDNRTPVPIAFAISWLEDFLPPPDADEEGLMKHLTAYMDGSWENFPKALVILGGGFNKTTIGSIKRKFEELESVLG
ncbi:hypothetical protein A2U01_0002744 [Trifolium medium]|uniref:Gag-pol polyprotein n=1 Tax=Trifolium medium TaxID=97028 RepID=A0A392M3P0_9FABA|nr:hypothetical protein [Trifolium medium]